MGGAAAAAICRLLDARAFAQTAGVQPRRLIDIHHHFLSPEIIAKRRVLQLAGNDDWTPARSIEQMDANGVRTAFVSVSLPGIWYGDPQETARLARATNEFAARMASDYPGRFGFFAALALPDIEGSLREIEYSLDTLKADGIGLFSSYDGRYLGDPAFARVFDELQRRKAIVYVHPTDAPCCRSVLPDIPSSVVEYGFDTTRAVVSLLYSGTFTRCADVRFILSHGGGTVPFLAGRIVRSSEERIAELAKLYFETTSITNAPAMAALLKLVPATQVMFGSDYPNAALDYYRNQVAALRRLVQSGEVSQADLPAIEHETAMRLFRR